MRNRAVCRLMSQLPRRRAAGRGRGSRGPAPGRITERARRPRARSTSVYDDPAARVTPRPDRTHRRTDTRKEARLACVDSACRTGRAHAREVSAPRAPSIRSIRTPAAARHRGRGRTPTCGALWEQGNHWAGSVDREPPSARHAERRPRRPLRPTAGAQ